ncbi:hypothetical protein chiPu_0023077, partial [Chiloscyllium punctatum]|nr:hypothetical protein [Chiloscyllium punctatum]
SSIFTLQNIQLQKDPGYRNVYFDSAMKSKSRT